MATISLLSSQLPLQRPFRIQCLYEKSHILANIACSGPPRHPVNALTRQQYFRVWRGTQTTSMEAPWPSCSKESWHLCFQGTACTAAPTETLQLYWGEVSKLVVRLVSNFKIWLEENSSPSLFFFPVILLVTFWVRKKSATESKLLWKEWVEAINT